MNKNSKTLAVLLAALMAVSITACSNGDDSESEAEKTTTKATTTTAADETEPEEKPAEEEPTSAEEEPEEKDSDITASEDIQFDPADFKNDELKTAQLKEVAKFSSKDISFLGDDKDCMLYSAVDDKSVICYNYKGEKLADGNVFNVERLNDTDIYTYSIEKDGMIYSGLIDKEGNIIQAADNGVGMYSSLNDHFVIAFFPEGETKNEDEAIYYVTANQFSYKVQDGDVLYKGKVKVYDLESKKYLENTTVTESPNYYANGDLVSFHDKDNNIVYVNSEDKVVDLGYDYSTVGNDMLVGYTDDGVVVYDHELKPLFTSKYLVSDLTDSDDFFQLTDPDTNKKGIMYKNGAIVLEPKYGYIEYAGNGFFAYTNGDYGSKVGLLALDGTEVTKEDYKYVRGFGIPGFFNATKEDGKVDIIDETGKVIVADQDYGFSDFASYVKDSDNYNYMVWEKKEPALKLTSGTYLGHNMVYSYKEKTLFDQVTGNKLVEDVDKAHVAFGYLIITKGDESTVYSIE